MQWAIGLRIGLVPLKVPPPTHGLRHRRWPGKSSSRCRLPSRAHLHWRLGSHPRQWRHGRGGYLQAGRQQRLAATAFARSWLVNWRGAGGISTLTALIDGAPIADPGMDMQRRWGTSTKLAHHRRRIFHGYISGRSNAVNIERAVLFQCLKDWMHSTLWGIFRFHLWLPWLTWLARPDFCCGYSPCHMPSSGALPFVSLRYLRIRALMMALFFSR